MGAYKRREDPLDGSWWARQPELLVPKPPGPVSTPQAEIERAIGKIEEAFQALDFGTPEATSDARRQVQDALDVIRYEQGRAKE